MTDIEKQVIKEIGDKFCSFNVIEEKFDLETLSQLLQDPNSPVFLFPFQSGSYYTTIKYIIKEGYNILGDCEIYHFEGLIEKIKTQFPKEVKIIKELKEIVKERKEELI